MNARVDFAHNFLLNERWVKISNLINPGRNDFADDLIEIVIFLELLGCPGHSRPPLRYEVVPECKVNHPAIRR